MFNEANNYQKPVNFNSNPRNSDQVFYQSNKVMSPLKGIETKDNLLQKMSRNLDDFLYNLKNESANQERPKGNQLEIPILDDMYKRQQTKNDEVKINKRFDLVNEYNELVENNINKKNRNFLSPANPKKFENLNKSYINTNNKNNISIIGNNQQNANNSFLNKTENYNSISYYNTNSNNFNNNFNNKNKFK